MTFPSTALTELTCQVMNYAWGRPGKSSLVAKLAHENSGIPIQETTPYAELWIGTHPNAPSTLKHAKQVSLYDYLRQMDPTLKDLPFLMKVLSVGKPLSIQAHPDLSLAKRLFQERPQVYKDPNHKPEMAIAITPFEALFGFCSLSEITRHLLAYPEWAKCTHYATPDKINAIKESGSTPEVVLKHLLQSLFETPAPQIASALSQLLTRFTSAAHRSKTEQLFLDVHTHFPGDIGVFFVFLMNHVVLQPGQALFMGANELHAYLKGDCVEVMATSDNVIRAGLTPKFKDVPTLLAMLNYTCRTDPNEFLLHPEPFLPQTQLYNPPIREFSVYRTQIASQGTLPVLPSCVSLVLVTQGKGSFSWNEEHVSVHVGSILLVAKGTQVRVNPNKGDSMEIYQSFCNEDSSKGV